MLHIASHGRGLLWALWGRPFKNTLNIDPHLYDVLSCSRGNHVRPRIALSGPGWGKGPPRSQSGHVLATVTLLRALTQINNPGAFVRAQRGIVFPSNIQARTHSHIQRYGRDVASRSLDTHQSVTLLVKSHPGARPWDWAIAMLAGLRGWMLTHELARRGLADVTLARSRKQIITQANLF